MPFASLSIFPDISLSIMAPSKDHPIMLPTAPAYDETTLPPASIAAVVVIAFS